MPNHANEECRAVQVARAFFQAATKLSEDNEDILPQEDGADQKLSVFHLFSELFPEYANDKDRDGTSGKNGLMRLQFNKIGYEMYEKEQSRRVPAVRAKPGNPGYGFRRARWRNTIEQGEDRRMCESVLRGLGVNQERIDRIRKRVADFRDEWDTVRRPSRPAGPGRPRGHKRSATGDAIEVGGAAGGAADVGEAAAVVATPVPPPKKPKKATKARGPLLSGNSVEEIGVTPPPSKSEELPLGVGAGVGAGANAAKGKGLVGAGAGAAGKEVESAGAAMLEEAEWHNAGDGPEWVEKFPHLTVRGRGGREEGEDHVMDHVQTLMEENSSLRSLNMSLIYEREKVLRELRESDQQLSEMQSAIEALLAGHTQKQPGTEGHQLAVAFRWLCHKLAGRSRAGDGQQELAPHLRQVLEQCFDAYDEYQQSAEVRGEEGDFHLLDGDRGRHHHGNGETEQAGFLELHLSKHGSPSEDLRVELSRMSGSGRGKKGGQGPMRGGDALHPTGVVVKKEKMADEEGAEHHPLTDFHHHDNPDDAMCDSDMGDVGTYDYLFAHCSAATAF